VRGKRRTRRPHETASANAPSPNLSPEAGGEEHDVTQPILPSGRWVEMSRIPSHTVTRLLVASLAFLVLWPDAAAAEEKCLDQVRKLADGQGISTVPPTMTPGRDAESRPPGSRTEELGRSGGVIAPPQREDRSVIAPPSSADTRMPTMPDVTPPDRSDRPSLQALLVAARAEGERGREEACLDRLAQAKKLVQRQSQ